MRNLIYIVAIGMEVKNHVAKAWDFHSRRHKIDFKIITDPSDPDMAPHWERYTAIDRYPNYDNYLYVDADALVKWDAPNFFEILPAQDLYVVKDIGSLEWTYNSILGYQDLFSGTQVNWWDYFTTGFLKFTQSHGALFRAFINFYQSNAAEINKRQYETLRKGFDQTPFNYFVRQEGYKFQILPEIFSLGHLPKKDIFSNLFFLNIPAFIWQFNGIPKERLPGVLDNVWGHVQDYYE